MKRFAVSLLFAVVAQWAFAQEFNNFGLRIGMGDSHQHWEHSPPFEWVSGTKDKQRSYELFLLSELAFNEFFSLRAEIGIMEKGFYSDRINWDIWAAGGWFEKNTVEIKNISLNLSFKATYPILSQWELYYISGIKLDYMYQVSDWVYFINGEKNNQYHRFIFDHYKTIIPSGLIGGGLEYNNLLFLEFQYNFPLTSSTINSGIEVKDFYRGISLGIYL